MPRLPRRSFLGGLAAAPSLAFAAPVDDDAPAEPASEASRLLDEVVQTYRKLNNYDVRGRLTARYSHFDRDGHEEGPPHDSTGTASLIWARPNKLVLDLGALRLVTDGNHLATVVVPYRKYTVVAAPETITLATFSGPPYRSLLFRHQCGVPLCVLMSLLIGKSPGKLIRNLLGPGALTLSEDAGRDGKRLKTITADKVEFDPEEHGTFGDPIPPIRLKVDPTTLHLEMVEEDFPPPPFGTELATLLAPPPPPIHHLGDMPPAVQPPPDVKIIKRDVPPIPVIGSMMLISRVTWSAGAISTDYPKAGTFAFRPPEGFKKVEKFERLFEMDFEDLDRPGVKIPVVPDRPGVF